MTEGRKTEGGADPVVNAGLVSMMLWGYLVRCPAGRSRTKSKAETKALNQGRKSGAPERYVRFLKACEGLFQQIFIYVPGTKDRAVNKTDKISCLHGV